ncbi:biliverdin-producing heme oxygenase [Pseudomonas capeferrum]|uniref:biliverdin-producing heme oxygenase n=1 Tax=Pseudomonas capeferrum TaxID=1495066 RepID=UPI0030DB0980
MTATATRLTVPGRCARLKASSSRDHDSVDELVMAARPFEDRERYARFLQVQHRFHGSLLALYHDELLNDRLPGLMLLSRFAAVERDLLDLGLALPSAPPTVIASPAQALGWLYCSEGSNLGAAFLFKQTQRLGLDGNQGARHLAPHPDGRALHWREFVARVDGLALDAGEEAEAIVGVIAAFDSYRGHLRAVFAGG